jgi:replicative DNA helicase
METLNSKEFISGWKALQAKRKANPEKYRLRSTGLRALDRILGGGVEYGQVIIYGGAQKVGKSTLLQHTAKHFGLAGDPFGFFSLEMHNTALATRLLCDMSGVEKDRIRSIEWSDSDWERLEAEADIVENFDSWWSYGVPTVTAIKQILTDIRDETGVLVNTIFVDYMQLMSHPGKSMRQEELSAISRAFKRMSIEMEEPMLVFLAAQVNRDAAKNQIISANTFLGTGDIERDMDVGVIMHTINDDDGKPREDVRQLTVVGSRETSVGTAPIRFNGKTSSVRDMEAAGNEITIHYWTEAAQGVQGSEDIS